MLGKGRIGQVVGGSEMKGAALSVRGPQQNTTGGEAATAIYILMVLEAGKARIEVLAD